MLTVDVTFQINISPQSDPPHSTKANLDVFSLVLRQPLELAKNVQL